MYIGKRETLDTYLYIKRSEMDMTKEARQKLRDLIHQEKVGLRNAYRLEKEYEDGWEWHVTGECQDSMWGKYVCNSVATAEEIKEFIEEEWCHWYNPYNDGRDCTGVWFTTSIKVFVVEGKTIAYHFKSCDI